MYKKGPKGKLDAIFSLYIRTRDKWICRRCHTPQPYKSKGYHCAHMKGRRNETLRWSDKNAFGMCYGCHSFIDEHADEKMQWYVGEFGQEAWDRLVIESNETSHFKTHDILDKIDYYNGQIILYTKP